MRITSISFKGFPPFFNGTILFPPQAVDGLADVQFITGQNGTGKTRILSALAAACGNSSELDRRSDLSENSDLVVRTVFENAIGIFVRSIGQTFFLNREEDVDRFVSEWTWHPAERSSTSMDVSTKIARTTLRAGNFRDADCQFVESLLKWRSSCSPFSAQAYRGSGRIGECPDSLSAMKTLPLGEPMEHLVFDRERKDADIVCQALVNLKIGAAMEMQSGVENFGSRGTKLVQRFESAVSAITGRPFSFIVKPHPKLRLIVKWGSDSMEFSGLPDGLQSIVGWLVACVAKLEIFFPDDPSPLDVPLILILDEPETHLHPAWQRHIIPAAQKLFPNAQIFVATHSPFVISSVNSGWIHVLRTDKSGIVTADDPKPCSKGDSWIDAVEDVLGVTEWYDPETEALLTEFRALKRKTLSERGDLNSLKEKAEAIASRSQSLRSMMAREMHQLQRNMAEAVAEP